MLKGYCIMVRDYKAEIVEFTTLTIATMPDESKLYLSAEDQKRHGREKKMFFRSLRRTGHYRPCRAARGADYGA